MTTRIFFCSAQEDQVFIVQLRKHMKLLEREGHLMWHAQDIHAGADREQEISQQFSAAQIILLLVTANFLNSDSCDAQMKQSIERRAEDNISVIPIILSPSDWENSALRELQVLPTGGVPVTKWSNQDEAFENVVKGIRQVVNRFSNDQQGSFGQQDSSVDVFPSPPQAYFAHPYILMRHFFGRQTEILALNDWANSSDAMLIIEALGGMGKSALTWHWVKEYAQTAMPNLSGIIWWSFYESNATMSNFIRHALAYITRHPLSELNGKITKEHEFILLRALQEKRYLLIFDGIERILVAYHRSDASHLTEEQVEQLDSRESLRIRKCIDPSHGAFLRNLVNCTPSKILISTRLLPQDVQDIYTKQLMPGVSRHLVKGLSSQDTLLLIRHFGIRGNATIIRDFMGQFGYHPLLLHIIVGRILDYRPAPGDFDTWYSEEGKQLQLLDLDLAQRRTHILQYAFDGLKPELRKFLSQIAVFRYAIEYAALKALNPYLPLFPEPGLPPLPRDVESELLYYGGTGSRWTDLLRLEGLYLYLDRQHGTESEREILRKIQEYKKIVEPIWKKAEASYKQTKLQAQKQFYESLTELENRGLLQWDRVTNRYDLHPVVRAYAYEQLEDVDRKRTFTYIRDHFKSTPPENLGNIQELSDLRRTLEIYNAMVGAGLFDDALSVYQERLKKVLETQLAASYTIIELLTPLFPGGLSQFPLLSSPRAQSACINDLANAYLQIGESIKAISLEEQVIKREVESGNTTQLCIALTNYHLALMGNNQLAAAFHVLNLAHALAVATDHAENASFSYLYFLEFYSETGQWKQAQMGYQKFKQTASYQTIYWQISAETAYARCLLYRNHNPQKALDRAWRLAVQTQSKKDQLTILSLKGEVALQREQTELALNSFQNAVNLAQTLDVPIANHLGNLAHAYTLQGQMDEACRLIEQALNEGEPHQSAAKVYFALGKFDDARRYAIQAYKQAWADGPPFSWQPRLQQAKQLLDLLETPEPIMLPSSPDVIQLIPCESEIRNLINAHQSN